MALALFLTCQIAAPRLFDGPRLALFDAYQSLAPRHRDPRQSPVVIVAVDDASLQALGRWPWPRTLQARLVRAILAGRPAAVGLDMLWPERSTAGDDAALARALGDGPVAIGVAGLNVGGDDAGPLVPVALRGGPGPPVGPPVFAGALRSLRTLDLAAAGHGLLSNDPDRDGVFRHLRLISTLGGRVAPDLGLETYRLAAQAPFITVYATPLGRGVAGVGVGASTFPTEPDGGLWIDYTPRDEWPVHSASAVLSGRVPAGAFDGRLVLVGVTALGQADQLRRTPVGAMSGVEINAQGLENLLAGKLARRPAWAPAAEAAITLALGLFLILVTPAARGPWRVLAGAAPLAILWLIGPLLWADDRLILDVATPTLGCAAVLMCLTAGGLAEADGQRRRLRRDLEIGRLAAARAEGEMAAARRIQLGILPRPEGLAPDPRFDLDAVMVAASSIGGDLYDFFKIDDDHLFIAVGDVSGKGLPASLFMALGKALCKSCALRGETDIGAIVRRANAEISRDNPEMLFITLFAGILDLRSGGLDFCNAGHDAPFLLRPGEPPAAVTGEGGPPLCVLDDFPYATETWRLAPGDLLCLTTDGVTEAMTASGRLLGRAAVERALAALPPGVAARTANDALQAAVRDFVAGAEPSDDLTILTLRWSGASAR